MTTDSRSISSSATDYSEGIKKEVAEIKFLIHDLRVEGSFNDILHYHVTLNTDLEIYNLEQAQALHEADLLELKAKLGVLRKVFNDYSNAVKSFSPDRTVLLLGRRYINTIHETCHLVLSPLWGRSDQVLTFLPEESRSVRSRRHYRNSISWLYGVQMRIAAFREEFNDENAREEFDIAKDIRDFTQDVVRGYVVEKSEARVELQFNRLDSAVIAGNRQRFRRMYFNLVMNAVDAMSERKVGVLNVSTAIEGGYVALRVRDDGAGMTPEKIRQLLTDRQTLDGELHSLGFVFVRQTVAEFRGELSIESAVGKGTTMTILLPYLQGKTADSLDPSRQELFRLPEKYRSFAADVDLVKTSPELVPPAPSTAVSSELARAVPAPVEEGLERQRPCGKLILEAFKNSTAQFPGSIFAIAVTEQNRVEMFTAKPYQRDWNITHEDLTPMYFQAVHRGRLEEDELKKPVLILKPPQNMADYFDFKEVPEADRDHERFTRMVQDECIRVARKLIETGLDPQVPTHLASARQFFATPVELHETEPFPLDLLSRQKLSAE